MGRKRSVWHILTAADKRVGLRQAFKLIAQFKGAAEGGGEAMGLIAGGEEAGGSIAVAGGGVTGDFAFEERFVEAADPGRFAGGEKIGQGFLP
jgi:hypothetical protein